MQTLFRLNTDFEHSPIAGKNPANYYHKIIGSSVFGFEDFSILSIEGFHLETLKGTYEHFSQFLYDIPEDLHTEKFIVWEGYIYTLAQLEAGEFKPNKKEILFFDGLFRRIRQKELLDLLDNPQLLLTEQ